MHINNQARSPASNRPVSGGPVDGALPDQTSTALPDQQSTAGVPRTGKIVAVQQIDWLGREGSDPHHSAGKHLKMLLYSQDTVAV